MNQQDERQSLAELSKTVNIALVAMFSVNRQVQVWSHLPGSCGAWYLGWTFLAGSGIAGLYYTFCVAASGTFDAIPFAAVACASWIWAGVHQIASALASVRGEKSHSYEPGIAYLQRFFPEGHVPTVTLVADLLLSMNFSFVFWLCESPIQSSFYGWLCLWLIVAHVWIEFSHARRLTNWQDSQLETERFSEQIGNDKW